MHSTHRKMMKRILISGVLIGGLAMTAAAQAEHRSSRLHDGDHRRHEDVRDSRRAQDRTELRQARRVDWKLDRRGQRIDPPLDFLAFVAAASGQYELAHELDRAGDRIERRVDRYANRVVHKARKQTRRNHARSDAQRHYDSGHHDPTNRQERRHEGMNRHFVKRNLRFR